MTEPTWCTDKERATSAADASDAHVTCPRPRMSRTRRVKRDDSNACRRFTILWYRRRARPRLESPGAAHGCPGRGVGDPFRLRNRVGDRVQGAVRTGLSASPDSASSLPFVSVGHRSTQRPPKEIHARSLPAPRDRGSGSRRSPCAIGRPGRRPCGQEGSWRPLTHPASPSWSCFGHPLPDRLRIVHAHVSAGAACLTWIPSLLNAGRTISSAATWPRR
jgi:hypothetical protein